MKQKLIAVVLLIAALGMTADAQWTQQGAKLVGTGAVGGAQQGISASISSDGNTAIVGGARDNNQTGAAWVFARNNSAWIQQGPKLVGTGAVGHSGQGIRVAISSDGNTTIIGGYGDNATAGAAWIFTRNNGVWTQQGAKLFGTGAIGPAQQGASVSISSDGNTAIVGAPGDNSSMGAAWIFTRNNGVWTQQGAKLVGTGAIGPAQQGASVSISSDGNTAIVGGSTDNNNAGAIWVFTRSGSAWTQQGAKLVGTGAGTGNAQQGYSVSISSDGNTAIVGGPTDNSLVGAAWVFTRNGSVWTQQGAKLVGTGAVGSAGQGISVSITSNGNMAIVGGYIDSSSSGAVWIFTRNNSVWTQQGTKLVGTGAVGSAHQGSSTSISSDGSTAIVGGFTDNNNAGAIWVYAQLSITRPQAGERWIAGDQDTIRWTGGHAGQLLDIELSVDSGMTYTLVDFDIPADSGYYSWTVRDSLTTRAKIRLVDSFTSGVLAVSDTFRVKGYVLTRFTPAGRYEAFNPNTHGWNYQNGSLWPFSWWSQFHYLTALDPNTNNSYPDFFHPIPDSTFIDWPLWVDVFSTHACYWTTFLGIYDAKAQQKWKRNGYIHNGSCFGFAASSFLAFSFKDQFLARHPGIPNFTSLFSLPMSNTIRSTINGYFAFQFGRQSLDNDKVGQTKDPRTTLQEIKTMFITDAVDIRTITIYNHTGPGGTPGGGAHTMAPIRIVKDNTGPSRYRLMLYDSNNPGSSNFYVLIDSLNNTWTDFTGLGATWTGTSHFYLEIPVSNYLSTPVMGRGNTSPDNIKGSGNIEFYNTSKANIIYTASNGNRIGFVNGIVTNEIMDGVPIFNKNGRPSDPIGYYIPDDAYSIILSNITDPTGSAYLTAFKERVIYNYERGNADSSQVDRFKVGEGFSVASPDTAQKHITLHVIAQLDSSERIFIVRNAQLRQSDSLYMRELGESDLMLKNYGSAKAYELEINERSTQEEEVFVHHSITLQANSSHTIVPNWDDLNGSPVTIWVDLDNNGTIDDTLIIVNQSTGVDDRGSIEMPSEYSLAQNFPNPFNPSTTIKYQLPIQSHVTLKLYNLLGQGVATLVDAVEEPGYKSVQWDASEVASGVYFYRLEAGSFTSVKKLLLLR